jgi:hypothetical protein
VTRLSVFSAAGILIAYAIIRWGGEAFSFGATVLTLGLLK